MRKATDSLSQAAPAIWRSAALRRGPHEYRLIVYHRRGAPRAQVERLRKFLGSAIWLPAALGIGSPVVRALCAANRPALRRLAGR